MLCMKFPPHKPRTGKRIRLLTISYILVLRTFIRTIGPVIVLRSRATSGSSVASSTRTCILPTTETHTIMPSLVLTHIRSTYSLVTFLRPLSLLRNSRTVVRHVGISLLVGMLSISQHELWPTILDQHFRYVWWRSGKKVSFTGSSMKSARVQPPQ